MAMDDDVDFSFSAPMQELHEIAIISIAGGTNVPLAEKAYKRRSEIEANNKQELAGEVFRHLDIAEIGGAVEQRPLHVLGHDKPWTIDICTTKSIDTLYRTFGDDLTGTVVLDLVIDCLVDVKLKKREKVEMRVEVGVVGQWNHFLSLGKRGKRVLTDCADTGYHLIVVLDQNVKAYPYQEPEWQRAASYATKRYLVSQLHHDLDTEEIEKVRIEEFAVEPIVPLNDLNFAQSARGLKVHYIVHGLMFDRMPVRSEVLLHAPRMQLTGNFPTGRLSEDGLRPEFGPTRIRLKCPGMREAWRVMGSYWYPPSAQQEKELQDAAAAAAQPRMPPGAMPREPAWQFPNQRNVRRNGMRKKAAETARHARWADAEEGELSSDGQSSTMSKVARKVGGMGWGSSSAHGYPRL